MVAPSYSKDGTKKKKIIDCGEIEDVGIKTVYVDLYNAISAAMKLQSSFECRNSGTTSVTLAVCRETFTVSNAGDSRCIIFR